MWKIRYIDLNVFRKKENYTLVLQLKRTDSVPFSIHLE